MFTMENSKTETQTINFTSSSDNITLVEKFVDNVCEEFEVNEDYYGNILIALTEAVNNAIYHGNKQSPDKNISVSFKHQSGALNFVIEDEGEGFDFENLPDPTAPENIEKPNGRGVFLMKNLADEVSFSNEGRTVELNFQTK